MILYFIGIIEIRDNFIVIVYISVNLDRHYFPTRRSSDLVAFLTRTELLPQTPLPRKTQPKRSPAALPRRSTPAGLRENRTHADARARSFQPTIHKRRKPHVSSSTSSRSTIGVPDAYLASVESR